MIDDQDNEDDNNDNIDDDNNESDDDEKGPLAAVSISGGGRICRPMPTD